MLKISAGALAWQCGRSLYSCCACGLAGFDGVLHVQDFCKSEGSVRSAVLLGGRSLSIRQILYQAKLQACMFASATGTACDGGHCKLQCALPRCALVTNTIILFKVCPAGFSMHEGAATQLPKCAAAKQ